MKNKAYSVQRSVRSRNSFQKHLPPVTYQLNPVRGFTLVETMVAIAVLAVALVGPFVAAGSALRGSNHARDELVASALAQEGVEYIRSIRDGNYLASPQRAWTDGFSSYSCYGATPTGYCTVDPTRGDIHAVPTAMQQCATFAACAPLNLSSTNLYNQQPVTSTNIPTRFTRAVQLTTVGSVLRVDVTVRWVLNGHAYSTTVNDVLTDWL